MIKNMKKNGLIVFMFVVLPIALHSEEPIRDLAYKLNNLTKKFNNGQYFRPIEQASQYGRVISDIAVHSDINKPLLYILTPREISNLQFAMYKTLSAKNNMSWTKETYDDLDTIREQSHDENEFSKHLNEATCFNMHKFNTGQTLREDFGFYDDALRQDTETTIKNLFQAYDACLKQAEEGREDLHRRAEEIRKNQ